MGTAKPSISFKGEPVVMSFVVEFAIIVSFLVFFILHNQKIIAQSIKSSSVFIKFIYGFVVYFIWKIG
jgi:hypothetical protein